MARKQGSKDSNKITYIYCCSEQTEKLYFQSLVNDKRKHGFNNIKVIPIGKSKSAPINSLDWIVEKAIRGEKNQGINIEKTWMVFDIDEFNVDNIESKAKNYNIQLAYSNRCFELWFLLHYEYTTAEHKNASQTKKSLERHIANYAKNDDSIYDIIKDRTNNAISHAKRLETYHQKNGNSTIRERNPSTTVYKLVEEIN